MLFSRPPNRNLSIHGFTQEEEKSKNRESQAPQASPGEPAQEAVALQELTDKVRSDEAAPNWIFPVFRGAPHRVDIVSSG